MMIPTMTPAIFNFGQKSKTNQMRIVTKINEDNMTMLFLGAIFIYSPNLDLNPPDYQLFYCRVSLGA